MANVSDTKIRGELRDSLLAELASMLENAGYSTILQVKGNKLAVGVVDKQGNDRWAEYTIAIPTGARDDEDGYDAELMAIEYKEHQDELKEKAEAREAKKKADAEARAKKKAEKLAAKKEG